jgi:hypothetical protein
LTARHSAQAIARRALKRRSKKERELSNAVIWRRVDVLFEYSLRQTFYGPAEKQKQHSEHPTNSEQAPLAKSANDP